MSKIFYDHLIALEDLEKELDSLEATPEEKEELWKLVDEILHHRVLGCILDRLPNDHHEEFLSKFHEAPHDEYLLDYLKEKIGENIEEIIRGEIGNLAFELLKDIRFKAGKAA